ncbi:MAG: hypothetical protein FJ217_10445 [Ignavibacteria bacterium]|nr:hypothetical protein [Ignavibacteria bacterium]
MSPDLLWICSIAFIAVFIVLSLIAVVMRGIMMLFPDRKGKDDAAVIAALSTVLQTTYPGTRITKIEEAP